MEITEDKHKPASTMAEAPFEPILVSLGESSEPETPSSKQGHHGWTLMLIAAGIGLIAGCILIPQSDENRRLAYECLRLKADLEHMDRQTTANTEFISRVGSDPILLERLAQRQMRFVRQGTNVLFGKATDTMAEQSPFALVAVDPPASVPEFRTPNSRLADLCRDRKSRLYVLGGGLMLLATGLVLGSSGSKQ